MKDIEKTRKIEKEIFEEKGLTDFDPVKARMNEIKIKHLESEIEYLQDEIVIWSNRAMQSSDEKIFLNYQIAECLTKSPKCKYKITPLEETMCGLLDKKTGELIDYGNIAYIKEFLEETITSAKNIKKKDIN